MGSRSAKKQAKKAEKAAKAEAEQLRQETEALKDKERREKEKANLAFRRSQLSRGGGFFEQDFTDKLG